MKDSFIRLKIHKGGSLLIIIVIRIDKINKKESKLKIKMKNRINLIKMSNKVKDKALQISSRTSEILSSIFKI